MSFTSSIFKSLRMSYTDAGINLTSAAARYGFNAANGRDGNLIFRSNGHGSKDLIVYAAKRTLMQEAFARINSLYPKAVKAYDTTRAKSAYETNQGSAKQTIIQNGREVDEENSQGVTLKYKGKPFNEGLLLWIKGSSNTSVDISVNTYWDKVKGLSNADKNTTNESFASTTIKVPTDDKDKVFLDLGASVQIQSSNNVVLTKVVGRDWSRKEFVSGGDANFTVTGKIVSNYPDVYPYAEVSKFITLMQHKGILQVYNLLFQQLNVTQILIKDFQMGQNEGFKNVQPYSFTCVGVEPDEEVTVAEDTIKETNLQINSIKKKGWGKVVLDKLKETAANQAATMLEQLTANTI